MISYPSDIELEALQREDLHEAEQHFVEIKTRMLSGVMGHDSFRRARRYLRTLEDMLADRHETRRAGRSRNRASLPGSDQNFGTSPT